MFAVGQGGLMIYNITPFLWEGDDNRKLKENWGLKNYSSHGLF